MFQEEEKDDTEEAQAEKTSTDKEHDAKSDTSDEEKVKVIIFGWNKYIKKLVNSKCRSWFYIYYFGDENVSKLNF